MRRTRPNEKASTYDTVQNTSAHPLMCADGESESCFAVSPYCHDEAIRILEKELREMRFRCAGIQKKLDQSESARKQAMAQREEYFREAEALRRELEAANARLEQQSARIIKLSCQAEDERSRMILVRKAFEAVLGMAPHDLDAGEEASDVCVSKLSDLKLSAKAMAALERAGIHDLESLCGSTSHSLSRLGVGSKNIAEIEACFSEKGLCLRGD